MGQANTREKPQVEQLWEAYQSVQLSPEQRLAARQRAEARAEQARIDGVYDRALEIAGTVKWSIRWDELRLEE